MPTTPSRTRSLVFSLLAVACGPRIEEEPPIPEHRLAPCESWCSMMFDPVCPAQDVEVPTEEECFENCIEEEGVWAPVDGQEECAATQIPYVECLAELPCEELQQHFIRGDGFHDIPPLEWSSCGELVQAQLDCQTAHY